MASGLSSAVPPPSLTPPLLVEPPPEDGKVDVDADIEIDLDDALDRPLSRSSATSSTANWNDIGGLLPSAAFLSPDTPRSIRRPASSMSTESALSENGLVPAAPAPGPFNFQTQSMSTSPVRSVCCPSLPIDAHIHAHKDVQVRLD